MDSLPLRKRKRKSKKKKLNGIKSQLVREKKLNLVCIARGCNSLSHENPDLIFHELANRRIQKVEIVNESSELTVWSNRDFWLHESDQDKWQDLPLRQKAFCSKHFRETDYDTTRNKKILKLTAIPSINLSNEPTKDKEEKSTDSKSHDRCQVVNEADMCLFNEKEREKMLGRGCYAKECVFYQYGESYYKLPKPNAQRVKIFDKLGFHSYMDRRELWLLRLQIKDSPGVSICSKHFKEDDFYSYSGQVFLKKTAVPSCHVNDTQIIINCDDIDTMKNLKSTNDMDVIQDKVVIKTESDVLLDFYPKRIKRCNDKDENLMNKKLKYQNDDCDDVINSSTVELLHLEKLEPEIILEEEKDTNENKCVQLEGVEDEVPIDSILIDEEDSDVELIETTENQKPANLSTFYQSIQTVDLLISFTGIVHFRTLDDIIANVRNYVPQRLEQVECLLVEDRVLLCMVRHHLKLSFVIIGYLFKVTPETAEIVYTQYRDIVMSSIKRFTASSVTISAT